MPFAASEEADIWFEVDGTPGAPWLTFSNGLCLETGQWDRQVEAFGREFRILRYDTRGHGRSGKSVGAYSFNLLANDVLAVWDHLGIKKSSFCGLSLGGMTGLTLALDRPDRIDRLVACDCRGDCPPALVEQWGVRHQQVISHGMGSLVEESLQRWLNDQFRQSNPAILRKLGNMIRRTSYEAYFGCSEAVKKLDVASRVSKITVPTLFVVGEKDGPHPDLMKRMHQSLPGSRYEVLPGAAHASNIDSEASFNGVVMAFLGSA
jgi:3-oxoadipate enol-lactonase